MAVNFRGYVFQDDGDAVNGATVQLLETGTTTVEASTLPILMACGPSAKAIRIGTTLR